MLRIYGNLLTVFILVSFFIACSDDSTSSNNDSNEPPTLEMRQIPIPGGLTNSTNVHAQMVVAQITVANSFTGYSAFFTPISGTSNNGVYEWTSAGLNIKMVTDESSDYYTWDIYLSGNYGGVSVNNWLYMSAESFKDGSDGSWTIYDPLTQGVLYQWNWWTGVEDIYNVNMEFTGGEIEIVSYPDESGSIDIYSDSMLDWTANWTSGGSGNWMDYDSEGNLADSGSW
ncbi:MAG: hypothetical protein KDF60_18760 [Calditrichaeota bacterium]|nr:hypothetical protein [Calditrichota bacterium]